MKIKKTIDILEKRGFDVYVRTLNSERILGVDRNNIIVAVNVQSGSCSFSYKISNTAAEICIKNFGFITDEKLWRRMYHQMKEIVYRFQI